MLFSYIGPETMLPVTSVIAAVAGVFMMFGRTAVGFGRNLVRRVAPGPKYVPPPPIEQPDAPEATPTPTDAEAP